MAVFENVTYLARPVEEVFDFLCNPANLIRVTPPELHMRLVDGPPRLELGSRITLQGRRWGIPQRIVSEVTALEPNVLLQDEQREGPFGKWVHTHRLEPAPEGTRMTDRIEFTAPGGLLGLVLTERRIEQDLEQVFAYRAQKFKEILG
jgi:ligand-binding SRPBCC domain-containing protein